MSHDVPRLRLHAEEILVPKHCSPCLHSDSALIPSSSIGILPVTAREGQKNQLEKKVEGLERIVNQQQQLMDAFLASLSQLQERQERITETIRAQQEELALRPDSKLSDLQQELAHMQSWHDTISVKLSNVDSDLASQKSWGSSARSRLDSHRSEIASLHQQFAQLSNVVESLDSKIVEQSQIASEDIIAMKDQLTPRDFHLVQQTAMEDLCQSLDAQMRSLQAQVDYLVAGSISQRMALMETESANMVHQVASSKTLNDADALRDELNDPEAEFSGALCRSDTSESVNASTMSELLRHIKHIASPSRATSRFREESNGSSAQRNLLEMLRLP